MPFCSQCGNQAGTTDVFCARCGARQPVNPRPGGGGFRAGRTDPLSGVTPRTASFLCYVPVIGWVIAIVVLASEKFRGDRVVRFHAFQGLYLFVAWLMNQWVLRWIWWPFPRFQLHSLIDLAILGMEIFMIVKALHEEAYSLPLFGELAQRSVAED
jgi:uncharacterized membrane protein